MNFLLSQTLMYATDWQYNISETPYHCSLHFFHPKLVVLLIFYHLIFVIIRHFICKVCGMKQDPHRLR